MAWDFSTDPEFDEQLSWIREFRDDQIEPLDLLYPKRAYHPLEGDVGLLVRSLQHQVKERKLWAPHLGPELGGQGYGQLKLGLINEILGGSSWAPNVFGTAAPDTGNAEIIAHYGTPEQKEMYLQPLLNGECFSCFSMTEPHAGSDPKMFTTYAVRDGDEWVLNGRKYFTSNARTSRFVIVMAWTNRDTSAYQGMSMFLVPSDTPGIEIERHIGLFTEPDDEGMHALIHYDNVRVPAENLLGGEGQGFHVAQTRLGGGRVHHAMRSVGVMRKALDMMCERALSRETQGSLLAEKQMVQSDIAESYAQLEMFRLLVLQTAWKIDQNHDYKRIRKDIAAIKFMMPQVLKDIVWRSMHLHGALGVSNEMPFAEMWQWAPSMAAVDGPTEVHKITVAQQVLKDYEPAPGEWPTAFLPARRAWAREVFDQRVSALKADAAMNSEMSDEARTEAVKVQEMANPEVLGRWMDEHGVPGEGTPEVSFISGGASNEIFCVERSGHRIVLRRPPRVVPKGRNETMIREYRILEALNQTDVAHPTAIAACADDSVLGAAFYLMDFVDGWSVMADPGHWPAPFDADIGARPGLAFELIDGAAKMANVDWKAVGLEGLGRPEGFHERQVDRWLAQWASYKVRDLPGIDDAVEYLRSYEVKSFQPGLMHGDYQFANVMFRHGAPAELAAIVDFEMGTIGDPMLDLAWVVMSWANADEDRSSTSYIDYEGLPDREDLLEYYATHTGRSVDEIDYYLVLGNFKMAIVLEGGYARMIQGATDNPNARFFGEYVIQSATKAGELARSTRLR